MGPDPVLNVPEIWTSELSNGIPVSGIEHHEVPLVNYAIEIEGGHLMDSPDNGTIQLIRAASYASNGGFDLRRTASRKSESSK